MTGSPVPAYDSMMQAVLDALHAAGGQASNREIDEYVAASMSIASEVSSLPHLDDPDLTELAYRLMWTRTYLKKYGLIDNMQRGRWTLTEAGRQTTSIDPRLVVRTVKSRRNTVAEPPSDADTTGEMNPEPVATVIDPQMSPEIADERISLTPDMPTYTTARHFIRIMNGVPWSLYRSMRAQVWEQRGNPQETVDWSEPDTWIAQRLEGDEQALALRLWRESDHIVNPRYLRGSWYLASRHGLLERGLDGNLCITQRGQEFLQDVEGAGVRSIDETELLTYILGLVAAKSPATRTDLLPDYTDHCRRATTTQSDNAVRSSLWERLVNLADRGYVMRSGRTYAITTSGLAYLGGVLPTPVEDINLLANRLTGRTYADFEEYLSRMNPYLFEKLIKLLLEEMGYENVVVTSPTNDKGIDVVAEIELGISSVREVVQVKRHRGGINRTVLDQLRGSLYRFNAVRGTIITTGSFSKGARDVAFERGAPPITLIDGGRLMKLLVEHEIGVTKRSVTYYEFSPEKLRQFENGDSTETEES